ncbi:heat shock factor protein 1 isoform 2-T2 [Leptosomus discolor]
MEGPGAAAVGASPGGSNVPAFLAKLWTLVEDPDTDSLICWSPSGSSFHVFDQGQFAKEVLPKYFKHNNMASFVRQLNMYGFRKVVHIEQGGLVKPEKDDTEFQHPYFIRGQEHLLENIKRKVTSVSNIKNEDIKVRQDNVTKLLTDIQVMKGKQETMDSKLIAMKHENEALWREVASLRQKHAQQQKVVNKLIQFLISLVQSNRILGVKRKIPLMLNDSSSAHSMPKYSRQYSLEHVHGSSPYAASSPAYSGSNLYSPDSSANSGPIISDVTELAQSSPSASPSGSLDERSSPVVRIKEEPPSPTRSPQIEEASPGNPPAVETPLFPSTFIDSILQENEPSTTTAAAGDSTTQPQPQEKCLSVACLDKSRICFRARNSRSRPRRRPARRTQGSSWCTTRPSPSSWWTPAPWTWGAETCPSSSSWGKGPISRTGTSTRKIPPSPSCQGLSSPNPRTPRCPKAQGRVKREEEPARKGSPAASLLASSHGRRTL